MQTPQETERLTQIGRQSRAACRPRPVRSVWRERKRAAENLFTHFPDFWRLLRLHRAEGEVLIAVHVGGGVGDLLRFNALLRAVSDKYPQIRFDVYSARPTAKFIFDPLPSVRAVAQERLYPWFARRYDAYFDMGQITLPRFFTNIFPLPLLKRQAAAWRETHAYYEKFGALGFNQIIEAALAKNLNFLEVLGRTAGFAGAGTARPLLDLKQTPNLLAGRKYITFNTGWNKRDVLEKGVTRPTKCWPPELWEQFVRLLRAERPDIEAVQLGEANSPRIAGANADLLNKTTLPQAAAVLQGALVHVDCDCGLMHMAHALGVPGVTLFGPTHGAYVGYPENTNLLSPRCGHCWHLTENWDQRCPLYDRPVCMYSITPQMVLDAVLAQLNA